LRDLRIREKSATRRVVASCCNSALYLDFEKGHWLSIYRARLGEVLPPLQMRIQTRFIPNKSHALNDVPAYPGFPFRFIAKLFIARIAMLLPGDRRLSHRSTSDTNHTPCVIGIGIKPHSTRSSGLRLVFRLARAWSSGIGPAG